MEVTPHLKSVLKNYQYSATKSLHGPGLGLTPVKSEVSEEEFVPTSIPVQQVPILAAPDTTCSDCTDTILEGETISCFVVGGEKRLCLPQVLQSVRGDYTLQQINQECDQLQIYCSRCTPDQLTVLKNLGVLPSTANSSGLITKTDAERLWGALLHHQSPNPTPGLRPPPRKGATSFPVTHECFGVANGVCYPELYTSREAKCIECRNCRGAFAPQQFVRHVHKNAENRTVHWGFDSDKHWRLYLRVPEEHEGKEEAKKCLDEMRMRYEGKVAYPPPVVQEVKRKQIPVVAETILKNHDLPLKKQKIDEYLGISRLPIPLQLPNGVPQIYSNIDPLCLQYLELSSGINRFSAFKPVVQSLKDSKIRHATAMGVSENYESAEARSLREKEKIAYQTNVAMALSNPKYRKSLEKIAKHQTAIKVKDEIIEKIEPFMNGHKEIDKSVENVEKAEEPEKPKEKDPEPENGKVSVVQPNPVLKYNPEIELSTDTEDSASETSEKHSETNKLDEILKGIETNARDQILEMFKALTRDRDRLLQETQEKDERIRELSEKITELQNNNDSKHEESGETKTEVTKNEESVINSSSIIVESSSVITANCEKDVEKNAAPE